MELKDLAGKHILDGVDFGNIKYPAYKSFEDSQVCRFRLDGIIYSAIEDPDDGYRSCMRDLQIEGGEILNSFPGIEIIGIYKDKSDYALCDILQLISAKTGKVILEVGTENTDDYYPYFVADFNPEEMDINKDL